MSTPDLIKEKAYKFPLKTKEDRVRRGAYIDAMIIAKENKGIDIKEFVDFVISKNSELINDFELIEFLNQFNSKTK